MGKEDEFIIKLRALQGDTEALREIAEESRQQDQKRKEELIPQVDALAKVLQDNIQPLFEQVNESYLEKKGKLRLEKEISNANPHGWTILYLNWSEHAIWASMSTSRKNWAEIGGGSEVLRHHSKTIYFEKKEWKNDAKEYILHLLSNHFNTTTAWHPSGEDNPAAGIGA